MAVIRIKSGMTWLYRQVRRASAKAGQAPGRLLESGGGAPVRPARLTLIDFSADHFETRSLDSPGDCRPYLAKESVTWLHMAGLSDTARLKATGRLFDLHPLWLEDIQSEAGGAKSEEQDGRLLFVFKIFHHQAKQAVVQNENVSVLLLPDVVLSFQTGSDFVFESVVSRFRSAREPGRHQGADYLCAALLDRLIDSYFPVVESVADRLESIETGILERPEPDTAGSLHFLRSEILRIRRAVRPVREMLRLTERLNQPFIQAETAPYFRDAADHTIQLMDTLENLRETVSGLFEIYLTGISNRMNEVMKVLTLFAAIFIPLTFLAGIYGMNFKYMPELEWRYGYPAALLVMLLVGLGMVVYFKRKKWWL